MLEKKITFDSFIRIVIGAVVLVGLLWLLNRLSGVLLPFFIAWLIAYLIYPLVKFFQYKLKFRSRPLSIFCALAVVVGVCSGAFLAFVPPMVEEFGKLKELLVVYFAGDVHASSIPDSISGFIHEHVDIQWLNNLLSEENFVNTMRMALPRLWNMLAQSVNILFSIFASFIILLYVVFILLDYEKIAEGWLCLLPSKYRRFASGLVYDVQDGMNRYFRGQAFVAFCVGILFCIGFLIIDFPLAIGLGLFIGLLNLVPYLQLIGFIPTIMLALLKAADTGQSFWIVLLSALAVFCVVQLIQDAFIVPKVMGKITGLNPAIVLLSLSVWGSLMGILGMIIALPLSTLMLSYYQRYVIRREKMTEQPPEPEEVVEEASDDK